MPSVTLTPDRARAALWAGLGLVATSLAAYTVGSTSSYLFPTLLLVACAAPTAVFGLQVLAPETWTLEVDPSGVRGHVAAFTVGEPFSVLRAVELQHVLGEPVLVLLGHSGRRRLLLPVGCDVAGLRTVLEAVEHGKARGE